MTDAKDILFLVLALCALVLTGFLAWFLYYLVQIFRRFHETMEAVHGLVSSVREKIEAIDAVLQRVEAKLSSSVSALALLANAGKALFEHLKRRQGKKTRSQES